MDLLANAYLQYCVHGNASSDGEVPVQFHVRARASERRMGVHEAGIWSLGQQWTEATFEKDRQLKERWVSLANALQISVPDDIDKKKS